LPLPRALDGADFAGAQMCRRARRQRALRVGGRSPGSPAANARIAALIVQRTVHPSRPKLPTDTAPCPPARVDAGFRRPCPHIAATRTRG